MNFFGHAVIARRTADTCGGLCAEFVLGAMLPDFASMLRVRPPRVTDGSALQAGVRFHHATDDAFHGAESFLEFSRLASGFLLAHGLSRGSARAVAHVGVELLLDTALSEPAANEAYLWALGAALTEPVAAQIAWENSESAERFQQLCHTLRSRGGVQSNPTSELVAARLRNILASRPRLALDDAGQSVVRDWIVAARPLIVSRASLLVAEVERRLELANGFER